MRNSWSFRALLVRASQRAGVNLPLLRRRALRVTRKLRGERSAGASWYDTVYQSRPEVYIDHYRDSPYLPLWERIAGLIPTDASVLEIGCGTGQFAQLLLDNGVSRYIGFDFSAAAIDIARERLAGIDFQVADARTTNLVLSGPDVIVCTEVLEHITEDVEVLQRIPAGVRVLATVPDFDSETHVRWFSSVTQVERRYRSLFQPLEIMECALDLFKGRFFLLDGIRAP